MAKAMKSQQTIERTYRHQDGDSLIEVSVSYEQINSVEREEFSVAVPGMGKGEVIGHGPDRDVQREEKVMVEASIKVGGQMQRFTLPVDVFRTLVDSVQKVLPDDRLAPRMMGMPPY